MIKAYAEMVRDVTYKDDTKRTKDLNIIIEETDRLNVLVNDILELSKIQSGTQKLTIEQFDLEKFVKNIIKRYDIMSENKKYKFKVSINKNIIVSADRKRIEQVMYNLINNAINYTGDDKKIIINALVLENTVRIEVKDTGKGIDKEELENIWDKYYKIDKTHSREQVGSGVGLSIVKNILINHNCNYGVESIKGNGTTFYFELPKVK